uniref:SFRICE_033247 n=1 Tax=Spodoptera frugiperda TaxID=7108 RepID=A0A2H1W366_SPOFR
MKRAQPGASSRNDRCASARRTRLRLGRGFDPFDPRLLSIELDVVFNLNGLEVSPLSHCIAHNKKGLGESRSIGAVVTPDPSTRLPSDGPTNYNKILS